MTVPVEQSTTIDLGALRPPCTLAAFVYGELWAGNLVRSITRDIRMWPEMRLWDMSKDALISRSRSKVATMFLEEGYGDVLVMVDHDIGWEAGSLEHLVRVCRELKAVVGGVFPKRGFGIGVPIRFGNYGDYVVPSDRVVECTAVATGFIAIHRDILEAMAPTLPMTTAGYRTFFVQSARDVGREDGKWDDLSEDYDFCTKARELGFRVFADLRPELTHWGSHLYTMRDTEWKPDSSADPVTITVRDYSMAISVPDAFGGEIEIYIDENDQKICSDLTRGIPWEPEVVQFLAECLHPDDVVFDLGAHIGYEAVQLAPRVARWVAVEPMPDTFELLRKNTAHLANVDLVRGAIDAHNGEARMIRDYQNPGASRMLTGDVEATGIPVDAHTLGSIVEMFGYPDIVKMDIEGAEYLALTGADEALADCRMIVAEYCEAQLRRVSGVTGEQFLARLEELGFDTSDIDRTTLPTGRGYCNIAVKRRR